MCEVWFSILLPLFLFSTSIFYSVCCNLIISKEKHKVVIYLGVGDTEIFQHGIRACTLRGRQILDTQETQERAKKDFCSRDLECLRHEGL
jgi:hypothetical protein